MAVKFSFEYAGKGVFGHIYRPMAKVTFKSPHTDKFLDIWMIVDTGADHTILPRHLSEKLRISLERECVKDTTFGVGGEQSIYFYKNKIEIEIGPFARRIPLAFLDSDEIPPLFGRLGFLETFDVEFLKDHITVFKR